MLSLKTHCGLIILYSAQSYSASDLLHSDHLEFRTIQGHVKRETRFTSQRPANEIMNKIEEAAKPLGFNVHKKNYKVCEFYSL